MKLIDFEKWQADLELGEEIGLEVGVALTVNPQRLLGPATHVVVDEWSGNVYRSRFGGADAHLGGVED